MVAQECHVDEVHKPFDPIVLSIAAGAQLAVKGMGCPRCAMRVYNSLLMLHGVYVVHVSLEQGVASVAFDPQHVTIEELLTTITAAGNDGRHHYQGQLLAQRPAREIFVVHA